MREGEPIRKRLVFGTVFMLIFMTFIGLSVSLITEGEYNSFFADGSGTINDPYQISDVDELQNMNLDLDAHYILINDIDASNTSNWNWNVDHYEGFESIGTYYKEFSGTFDGCGFKITNLYINKPTYGCIGLFGFTDYNSKIENVCVVDFNITGRGPAGGLIGLNQFGVIRNCSSS